MLIWAFETVHLGEDEEINSWTHPDRNKRLTNVTSGTPPCVAWRWWMQSELPSWHSFLLHTADDPCLPIGKDNLRTSTDTRSQSIPPFCFSCCLAQRHYLLNQAVTWETHMVISKSWINGFCLTSLLRFLNGIMYKNSRLRAHPTRWLMGTAFSFDLHNKNTKMSGKKNQEKNLSWLMKNFVCFYEECT